MRHTEVVKMVHQVDRVAGVLAVDILELVFLQRLEQQIRVVVVAEERITQLAVTRATTNLVQQVGRGWLYLPIHPPSILLQRLAVDSHIQ